MRVRSRVVDRDAIGAWGTIFGALKVHHSPALGRRRLRDRGHRIRVNGEIDEDVRAQKGPRQGVGVRRCGSMAVRLQTLTTDV